MGLALLALACGPAEQVARTAEGLARSAAETVGAPGLDCDGAYSQAQPVGCLSGELRCGEEIVATTEGGDARWDDRFYAEKFCFPAGGGHDGPERVYLLHAPAYTSIDVTLQSDCADLDLVAVAYAYEGTCPGLQHGVQECEGDAKKGGGTITLQTFQNDRTYLVGVDGKAGATGPFRLQARCSDIVRR